MEKETKETEKIPEIHVPNRNIVNAVKYPWRKVFNDDFVKLGQDLLSEVVDWLQLCGLTRKIFDSRLVSAGEVVRYDKDEDRVAYVVSEKGGEGEIQRVDTGRYVYPTEFEVVGYPSFPGDMRSKTILIEEETCVVTEKKIRKIQEKALINIQSQEDKALIKLLTKAGEENNIVKADPYDIFQFLMFGIEQNRIPCDFILLNREDVRFLIENKDKFKDKIEFVTELAYQLSKDLINKESYNIGYVGKVSPSCMIITTPDYMPEDVIPRGKPIAVGNHAYLGGMPIRVGFFSEPISEETDGVERYGWFWYQLISMIVMNTNAVVLGEIDY